MANAAPPSLVVSKTDSALVNLRSRALDLHARLLELRDAVAMLRDGVGPGRNAPWSSFLGKYETLSKLFFQLTEELDRAVTEVGFQNFLLQPKSIGEDLDLVPNLLRTMLEPEVDENGKEFVSSRSDGSGAPRNRLQALEAEFITDTGVNGAPSLDDVERRILMFNAFVNGATERYEELREELVETPNPIKDQVHGTTPAAQALLLALSTGSNIP